MAETKHEFVDDNPYLVYTETNNLVYTGATNVVAPTGTISITENGTGIDIARYAYADVSVSGGDIPEGYYLIKIIQPEDGDPYLNKTWSELNTMFDDGNGWIFVEPSIPTAAPELVAGVEPSDGNYIVITTYAVDSSIESFWTAESTDEYPVYTDLNP